jgi:hypothetical protein
MIGIGFEVLAKLIAVLGGQFAEMAEELFDLLAGGVAQGRDLAEVGGVALNLSGVKAVLANEQAKAVAQSGLAISRVVLATVRAFLGTLQCDRPRCGRLGVPANRRTPKSDLA